MKLLTHMLCFYKRRIYISLSCRLMIGKILSNNPHIIVWGGENMAGVRMTFFREKLLNYKAVLHVGNEGIANVLSVKMINPMQTSFDKDVLYVGHVDELDSDIIKNSPANFLFAGNSVKASQIYNENVNNIISVAENVELNKLYLEAQDIMSQFTKWALKLYEAYLQDKGLDRILSIGSEYINNPIQVIDTGFKLIAGTSTPKVDDPIWTASEKNGYAPLSHISYLKSERFIEKVHKSKMPVYVHPSMHKYGLLISNIAIDGNVLGHVAVLEFSRPFAESDIDSILLLTEVVTSELQKSKVIRNSKTFAFENFISDLLFGNLKDEKYIEERTKALGWNIQGEQVVLTICAGADSIENTPFPSYRNVIERLIPNSRSMLLSDHLIFIAGIKSESPLSEASLIGLKDLLKENQLKCGVSRSFQHLSGLRKFYDQALKSIELGRKLDNQEVMYFYDDLAIYHLMDIRKNNLDTKELCSPALLKLIDYDHKNKTHYAHTLYTYLSNALDLTLSAERLFIHHNTMRFRIEKIQKLLNLDLKNGDVLFNLMLSFKVLKFNGDY